MTTRAVVCDDFMLLPPSGVPESSELVAGFEKTSAKVLGWPGVRGGNLKVLLLEVRPGGGADHGLEVRHSAFLFVTEGDGTLAFQQDPEEKEAGGTAQGNGQLTTRLKPRDGVVVSGPASLGLANPGGSPLRALYFESGFAHPGRSRVTNVGDPVVHLSEDDLPGTKSKPGDPKFTRHFLSAPELEVARITVQPFEATSRLETHLKQHVFVVLSGDKAEFFLGGSWRKVEPGDVVYINSFTVHGFRSNECILELLLVSSVKG